MARWTSESFHADGDLFALDSFYFVPDIDEEESDDGLGSSGQAHDGGRSYEADFDYGWAPHGGFGATPALGFDAISPTVRGDRIEVIDGPLAAKGGNGGDKPGNGGGKDKDTDSGTGDTALSTYTSAGDFSIEIVFEGTWTSELQQAFITAADFLSTVIIADVQDVFFRGKVIDDIRIDAELMQIDGQGGILGRAGPTAVRTSNDLPATGVMEFDVADAEWLDAQAYEYWDYVVLHEMIHCLGFGTLWGRMDLITVIDGEYRFTGAQAIDTYNDGFDFAATDTNSHLGVPVEGDGGSGTAGGHWDEETFDNELMTGWLNQGVNYLSDMSIAALDDMGYDTSLFADDHIA